MKRLANHGLAVAALAVVATGSASAHVDYVAGDDQGTTPAELVEAILQSPQSLLLLALGGLGLVGVCVGYLRFAGRVSDIEVTQMVLRSYRPYLPWMLRLSVGLPLVGAGFAGYLFSPTVQVNARLLQVGIGFLLLFGLATRVVAAIGLLTYFVSLVTIGSPLLLASEYVAGFLGIIVIGPGQPSADMLFRRLVITDGTITSRFRGVTTPKDILTGLGIEDDIAPVLVRLFLGLNFIYLGLVQKILQPGSALAVVAKYNLTAVAPVTPETWVVAAGLTEAVVGLAFIVGAFVRGTAIVGFTILTTTLFGLPDDPVLAHITLFGLTSVLMVTGAGKLSLDETVLPALRQRLESDSGSTTQTPAD